MSPQASSPPSATPGSASSAQPPQDLTAFEAREGELRLAKQVLDHKLIDIRTRRLVRANEIELMQIDGCYEVVGVDTGARGFLRRLLPSALARTVSSKGFRDWSTLEPLTHDLPSHGGDRLRRLHPADLADLVEASAHNEGEEIIAAVQADPEPFKPTCSRSSTRITVSSSYARAPTQTSRGFSPEWNPTRQRISSRACPRIAAGKPSHCSPHRNGGRSAIFSPTRPRQPAA